MPTDAQQAAFDKTAKMYFVAVDFDGTIVDHRYPDIGMEVPGAMMWLREFQKHGASLILYTMRQDQHCDEAVEWCRERGVEFWAVNDNPTQKAWTDSRKIYAHVYIDDAAAGCPLRPSPRMGGRPMVDWYKTGPLVLDRVMNAQEQNDAG